jgi:hypothetical protein
LRVWPVILASSTSSVFPVIIPLAAFPQGHEIHDG